MAKNSSSSKASANNFSIANQPLLRQLLTPIYYPATIRADPIREMALAQQDRRQWKPDATIRAPGPIQRKHARLKNAGRDKIRFAVPNKVALCVRRRQRKEVLHALKITGRKGTGRGKQRRQNFWSTIKC